MLKAIEQITSTLKNNIYWMTGGDIIEEILTEFLNTNNELKDDEKEALRRLAKCAITISKARSKSEQVVTQLDGLANDTLTAIRCHANVRNTIEMFKESVENIRPDLKEAIELFGEVMSSSAALIVDLDTMKRFAENTQGDLPAELDKVKTNERLKRHCGAAAVGIGGSVISYIFFATQFINPCLAVGIAAASAVAGVGFACRTEYYTIPEIEEKYKTEIERLEKVISDIGEIAAKADDLKKSTEEHYSILNSLQVSFQSANNFSRLFLGEEEDSPAKKNLLNEIEGILEIIRDHCKKFKELKDKTIEGINTEISRNSLALVPVVSCQ